MTEITYIDLNEVEKGQEHWLSVIARERAEAKREERRQKLRDEAPARYQEHQRKKNARNSFHWPT